MEKTFNRHTNINNRRKTPSGKKPPHPSAICFLMIAAAAAICLVLPGMAFPSLPFPSQRILSQPFPFSPFPAAACPLSTTSSPLSLASSPLSTASTSPLFSDYSPGNRLSPTGQEATVDPFYLRTFSQAENLYAEGRYAEAHKKFEIALFGAGGDKPFRTRTLYYLALCSIHLNDTAGAEARLREGKELLGEADPAGLEFPEEIV